jgi:hypothetical protein
MQCNREISTHHRVLLVLDRLHRNLGQEIIMKEMRQQVRLDRQALRQELSVKVLARLLAHQHAPTPLVLPRTTRPAHHLQYVHDGVVSVSVLLALEELNTHDDDHVTCHRILIVRSRVSSGQDGSLKNVLVKPPGLELHRTRTSVRR